MLHGSTLSLLLVAFAATACEEAQEGAGAPASPAAPDTDDPPPAAPGEGEAEGPAPDEDAPAPADLVLLDGRIFTADEEGTFVTALAVRDGAIVFTGPDVEAEALIGGLTVVIDLEGGLILPGLHDVHQHTLEAWLEVITCLLDSEEDDIAELGRDVRNCVADPVTGWVLGHGHSVLTLVESVRPPRDVLDDAHPDTPVAILEETSHSTWVNSAALELLGIDDDTPDPPGGIVVRDPAGRATGILVDAAGEWPWDEALAQRPELDELNYQALLKGLKANNEHGITSAVDARTYGERGYLQAYQRALADEALTVRMVLSLWAYPDPEEGDDAQIESLGEQFADDGGLLRVRQIKLYSDGLLQNTTAALLEPYEIETWGPDRGLSYFDEARLTRYLVGLQRRGFDMHIHAIGDRAVREALNAIAAGKEAVGGDTARHRLTHVEMIHPDDVPRFVELGAYADMQLSDWTLPAKLSENEPFIGRSRIDERSWPARELTRTGLPLALSSDYDVGPLSPFRGMRNALDRGEQSLRSVEEAVRAYTIHAARIMGSEARTGSLEVGKRADFVLVDRDLFEVSTRSIAEAEAVWTVLDGRTVHGSPD